MIPFADKLSEAISTHGPLCLGIDPHPDQIPAIFGPEGPGSLAIWGSALASRAAGHLAAIKVQSSFFERWGAAGVAAMEHVCRAATDMGLLVILDVKRSDIDSSARGYAEAYLGVGSSCPCDAMTVNPYLGLDSLLPFIDLAEQRGKGVAVLVRTSNAGAEDFQTCCIDGEPLYLRLARRLKPLSGRLEGNNGWSGLMPVVGANAPEAARLVREALPKSLLLVPGFGAQGGSAEDAVAGLVASKKGAVGGLVTASRSLSFPQAAQSADNAAEWEQAIDIAITEAQQDLAQSASKAGSLS